MERTASLLTAQIFTANLVWKFEFIEMTWEKMAQGYPLTLNSCMKRRLPASTSERHLYGGLSRDEKN